MVHEPGRPAGWTGRRGKGRRRGAEPADPRGRPAISRDSHRHPRVLRPSSAAKRLGVLPVLDAIGRRLSEYVIDEPFNPDPPGKFRVDDASLGRHRRDLQFALNAGGIIHMPDDDDEPVMDNLRGHTSGWRYMLAPWYPLPLTTGGRTLDLSTHPRGSADFLGVSRGSSSSSTSWFRRARQADEEGGEEAGDNA